MYVENVKKHILYLHRSGKFEDFKLEVSRLRNVRPSAVQKSLKRFLSGEQTEFTTDTLDVYLRALDNLHQNEQSCVNHPLSALDILVGESLSSDWKKQFQRAIRNMTLPTIEDVSKKRLKEHLQREDIQVEIVKILAESIHYCADKVGDNFARNLRKLVLIPLSTPLTLEEKYLGKQVSQDKLGQLLKRKDIQMELEQIRELVIQKCADEVAERFLRNLRNVIVIKP